MHFLMSPNPVAWFVPPEGKEADYMYVWVSVIKDSMYGSLTMAYVGYETYDVDHLSYEHHWYVDNSRIGEIYAHLTAKTDPESEFVYDVTMARIDIAATEHQLNATVIVKGATLFTAKFWADTSVPMQSRVETWSPLPHELYLSVEARRPLLSATVTELEHGGFLGGNFDYIDTELYDSSLLP